MLDPSYDPWLVGEINKLLGWINVDYIRSRCELRRQQNGRERFVFRPREDLGDVTAVYRPRQNKLLLSWFSVSRNDSGRPSMLLDGAQFVVRGADQVDTYQTLAQIMDGKFGPLNWAYLESSQLGRTDQSPVRMLQGLIEQYWPLDVESGRRRGICRGITNDILRGESAQELLAQQRRRIARNASRH